MNPWPFTQPSRDSYLALSAKHDQTPASAHRVLYELRLNWRASLRWPARGRLVKHDIPAADKGLG